MVSLSRSAGAQCRVALPRADWRYHRDQSAVPDTLHFAVDVRAAGPPSWLVERLAGRLGDLSRHPSDTARRRVTNAVATRHGRHPDEVLPLAGDAEAFDVLVSAHVPDVLARLTTRRAAMIEAIR